MGVLDWFRGKAIDEYVSEAEEVGATVIDVREPGEFRQGHVPGASNMPLRTVVQGVGSNFGKSNLLYLYCKSGVRSSQACKQLMSAGFSNVVNIGGIGSYRGPLER